MILGSILCVVAALGIVGLLIGPPPDTSAHKIQNLAFVAVILSIGLALSASRGKPTKS